MFILYIYKHGFDKFLEFQACYNYVCNYLDNNFYCFYFYFRMFPMKREVVDGEVLVEVVGNRQVLPLPPIVRGSTTMVRAPHRDTEHLTFGDCFRILDEERLGLMGVGLYWCWDYSTHMETLSMGQRRSVLNFGVDPVVPSIMGFNHLACGVIILGALKNIITDVCKFTYVLAEREYG